MYVSEYDNYEGCVDRIVEEMKAAKMTKKELAEVSGVSYGNLCRVMNGRYVATTPQFVKKIAHGLGVSPSWLCYGIK
jgi:transcriptional regulator with XRE-family HTH domain